VLPGKYFNLQGNNAQQHPFANENGFSHHIMCQALANKCKMQGHFDTSLSCVYGFEYHQEHKYTVKERNVAYAAYWMKVAKNAHH
jgi:hypothetical protein